MAPDRDTAPMWGKVEKGLVSVEYLEHLGTLAVGQFVCSLGGEHGPGGPGAAAAGDEHAGSR